MFTPNLDSEQVEVATTLIKILRNQVLGMLKESIEVGEYVSSTEEVIKEFYTPYLISLLTNSFKGGSIDEKTLKYNLQYMVAYFSELHKYSMIITEFGIHQKLKVNESIEVERRYDAPIVVNKDNPEIQEFAEKLIEALGFNKRINLAFFEKVIITKVHKKAFKLIIKHSYQMPITLIIPISTTH